MRFGTLQLCDEHARQSATQTSPEMAPFYPATAVPFYSAIDIDTEAQKKAMANHGTYQISANSDYGSPYHRLTKAAVAPWIKASADSVAIWIDTLPACVPPAFAVRYRELQTVLTWQRSMRRIRRLLGSRHRW